MQTTANYVEHNNWYNNMFAANIKTEPGTLSPPPQTQQHSPAPSTASSSNTNTTHLENYLKQQQFSAMDTNNTHLPNGEQQQQFFDTASMHQQLLQQQQYQQHFQQAQQAAAQNQVASHLPLGFNPLTPPGLPQAVLPAMSHFYTQSTQQQQQQRNHQQTPSPQPLASSLLDNSDKSALTPRHTPPMDITPPKSPKASLEQHQDQELMSNSSEDLKYIVDSDDDETIRLPIYNSHGKMKNYKCKSCGMVAITKLAFWDHAKTHMKPEKVLQCPKCPFVTELKHHLEYHIRKHKNLKPFQCDKCSYSCVNKSMLNSHRKSHSSVYQYRCADCDYATKYCHSFKLHLRKYDHKPGMVLDEEGIPNPSVVIDVYGTRRGPKNKGSSASGLKKSNTDLKLPGTSQLSAALQGFPLNSQTQMPASPAKSSSSVASELPALTLNMSLQQPGQSATANGSQISPSQQSTASSQNGNLPNLLPPLASLLQQNRNMAFFPYWNLNLQMLAAQQQAAVLAQLSPRMREQLQKQQQEQNSGEQQPQPSQEIEDLDEDEEELEDDQEFDRKSVDSAMDLSQGTPTKDDQQQQQTPDLAMNLKLAEDNVETPLFSSATANRRKGRVLKLDHEQLKANQLPSAPSSPQAIPEMPTASSPIAASAPPTKIDDHSSADESMETGHNTHNNPSNTSSTSTASSSGNSSNSSTTASSSSATSTANSSPSTTPTMYECKYCDIFFKDAVLYTIHMGYHSCDDVFKCNMCGEKCDGPVGLFVHMARNAHS